MFRSRYRPGRGRMYAGWPLAGGRTMHREGMPRARLIRVEVTGGSGSLLVATSPNLPEFRIVAYSHEDLEDEISAALQMVFKLKTGEDVEVVPIEPEHTTYPVAYAAVLDGINPRHKTCA